MKSLEDQIAELIAGWRTVAANGDTAAGLRKEIANLRTLVGLLEWGSCDGCGQHEYCPLCEAERIRYVDGEYLPGVHKDDCPIHKFSNTYPTGGDAT